MWHDVYGLIELPFHPLVWFIQLHVNAEDD